MNDVRNARVRLVVGRAHYDGPIRALREAKRSVWIATANLKDLHVEAPIGTRARAKGEYVSITEVLRDLRRRGVEVRILHASPPSRPFRASLALTKEVATSLRQCPRNHMKLIIVDAEMLYLGSANFTGAGLGARGEGRRNFELGIVTDDDVLLDSAQALFARIWAGKECASCKLRSVCPKPIDLLVRPDRSAAEGESRPDRSAAEGESRPARSPRAPNKNRLR